MKHYHDNAIIQNGLPPEETDISEFQGKLICGKFVDIDKPTWHERISEGYAKSLGEKFVPWFPRRMEE